MIKEVEKLSQALDTDFFKILSEPVRIELIKHLLMYGEGDVNSLSDNFTQDRSVISRHLVLMKHSGIVKSRKEGRNVIYALNGSQIILKIENLLSLMKKCLKMKCC